MNVHNDAPRFQAAARGLEKEFGLIEVAGPKAGRAGAGYKAGEREAEARRRARPRWEYLASLPYALERDVISGGS